MLGPEFSRADIGVEQKAHWREPWPICVQTPLDSSPNSWEDTKTLNPLASRMADVMLI